MRKFPVPWTVEQTSGGHFVVVDAKGFRIAYVYAREEDSLRTHYMTPDEAQSMARDNRHVWRGSFSGD
jgi:hypothetical protein